MGSLVCGLRHGQRPKDLALLDLTGWFRPQANQARTRFRFKTPSVGFLFLIPQSTCPGCKRVGPELGSQGCLLVPWPASEILFTADR